MLERPQTAVNGEWKVKANRGLPPRLRSLHLSPIQPTSHVAVQAVVADRAIESENQVSRVSLYDEI